MNVLFGFNWYGLFGSVIVIEKGKKYILINGYVFYFGNLTSFLTFFSLFQSKLIAEEFCLKTFSKFGPQLIPGK